MGSFRRLDCGSAAPFLIEDVVVDEVHRPAAEPGNDPSDDLGKGLEVVAALQRYDEPASAQLLRQLGGPGNELDICGGRERQRCQRIAVVTVDPQADQDDVRPELRENRLDQFVKGAVIGFIAAARGKRNVDRKAASFAPSDVFGGARARKDPVLMGREIEDRWRRREDIVRPVAMVGVVVEDRDASSLTGLLGPGNRDVVEVAETAAVVRPGVVARRSHESDRRVAFLYRHLRCVEDGPRGQEGDIERTRMNEGLWIERPVLEGAEGVHIRSAVNPSHVLEARSRGGGHFVEDPFALQPFHDGPQSIRALDMQRGRNMIEKTRIIHDHTARERPLGLQPIVA